MYKILVIEDNILNREYVLDTLQHPQFEILEAIDGDEGLKLAFRHLPDLILCDIMMPNVNGFEVLEEIRKNPKTDTTPFVFLTALPDRKDMRRGMELGADDFITKPFTPSELRSAVRAQLQKRARVVEATQKKVEEAKRHLTDMVTHELRTPLISINTVMQIISKRFDQLSSDQILEMMESVDTGSRRLTKVVDQMVYLTQIQSGVLDTDAIRQQGIPFMLKNLTADAAALARKQAQRNPHIDIIYNTMDEDTMVTCHPGSFKQALAEIIVNAMDFSPEDGEVIINQWEAREDAHLSVEDCGVGMQSKLVEQALQSFNQIDRTAREQQGMGLGLSLAAQVINIHNGSLEVRSVPGEGTTVLITVPVAK